jgi:hypothetical protein
MNDTRTRYFKVRQIKKVEQKDSFTKVFRKLEANLGSKGERLYR